MEAMRIHVERLVRPIRASEQHKNRMREEFLAHLEQRAAAARENGMSEDDAIASATKSLGDIDALRAELQATIPAVERMLFTKTPLAVLDGWFEKRPGESGLHYAWMRAVYTFVFVLVLFVPVLLVKDGSRYLDIVTGQHGWSWSGQWAVKHVYVPLAVLGGSAVSTFIVYWAADIVGLRRRLSNRVEASWFTRIVSFDIFVGAYFSLLLAMAVFVSIWSLRPGRVTLLPPATATFNVQTIALITVPPLALLMLAGSLVAAWGIGREYKQYERWGRLEIDN